MDDMNAYACAGNNRRDASKSRRYGWLECFFRFLMAVILSRSTKYGMGLETKYLSTTCTLDIVDL
jgi:hypothetical protein